jgi:Ras family
VGPAGHGFILVFAIEKHSTFNDLPYLREQILRAQDHSVPLIVAGAYQSESTKEDTREVSFEQAKFLADQWGAPYMEVCPREDVTVGTLFRHAADYVVNSLGEETFKYAAAPKNLVRVLCVVSVSDQTEDGERLTKFVNRELAETPVPTMYVFNMSWFA